MLPVLPQGLCITRQRIAEAKPFFEDAIALVWCRVFVPFAVLVHARAFSSRCHCLQARYTKAAVYSLNQGGVDWVSRLNYRRQRHLLRR